MIELAPDRIAAEVGGEVARVGASGRPARAVIDSREVGVGDLFFGLRGSRSDGGEHAAAALDAGAWGVIVDRDRAATLANSDGDGWVIAVDEPLAALQALARAWRRELGCPVVGITGSTGKTSVKDISRALLPGRVHASRENFNTEIGLPLTILEAPAETEILVLEMAMRGIGQIAELCEIAEPDVAAITNVGPVHLELLGTVEAIAEAKAEILSGLGPDGRAVVPADAEALEPHLADELETITFGPGGDVFVRETEATETGIRAAIVTPEGDATSSSASPRPTTSSTAPARSRSASRSAPTPGRWPVGWRTYPSRGCGASWSTCPQAPCWSTIATTPTRSRCRRRSTTSLRWHRRGAGSRCSAGWPSSGPTAPAITVRRRRTRAGSGSSAWWASASSPATTPPTSGPRTPRPLSS